MPKSLSSSARASTLPAASGRCSGQGVPICSGECGEASAGGQGPSVSLRGNGLPPVPLANRGWQAGGGAHRLLGAGPAWGSHAFALGRAEPPALGERRQRRGYGCSSSHREGRWAASPARRGASPWQRSAWLPGPCVLRGCRREQVCASPGRRSWVCCMAPCPSLPARLSLSACVSPEESVVRVHVSGCVCVGESRGCPAWWRGAAIAGAAWLELPTARHGFPGYPCCITETPGKTLLPLGASAGKGDGSARSAPSCPPASAARQRVAKGCDGAARAAGKPSASGGGGGVKCGISCSHVITDSLHFIQSSV